jgi:tetratricopeptide (TPR) repeat protein
MKKVTYDKASRKHTIIPVLGITTLMLVMTASIAGCFLGFGEKQDPNVLKDRGDNLFEKGQYDEALKAYDEATNIQPSDSYAWSKKGKTLNVLNKDDEALKAYDRAIEINPHDSNLWYNKIYILNGLGRYNDEVEAYDKIIEINSQNPQACAAGWFGKGQALDKLGKYDEELQAYKKAIEISPKNSDIPSGVQMAIRLNQNPKVKKLAKEKYNFQVSS